MKKRTKKKIREYLVKAAVVLVILIMVASSFVIMFSR